MLDVKKVASYIIKRYKDEFREELDEMKLHKLLYFTQRESIVRTGEPMFDAAFQAWKYGPVIVSIRDLFKSGSLNDIPTDDELAPYNDTFDYVFENYARKSSWTLALLSHAEMSWKNARGRLGWDEQCSEEMRLEDIKKDAKYIKMRRFYYECVAPNLKG